MRVTITATGSTKPVEIAGFGVDSVGNFRRNGQRIVQVAEFLRGTDITAYDRGNKRTLISFDVAREHTTEADAEAYVLTHADDIPARGVIEFTAKKSSGALYQRWLNNAVIESVDSRTMGATSIHSYQIVSGRMLTKKP